MVKTGYFRKRKDNSSNVSAPTGPGIETPYVMGSPDVIRDYPDLQGLLRKCLRFCSNPKQTCMDVCLTLHFEM